MRGSVSKRFVEDAIDVFLKNEEPEVLCIRGKWGTGKTYTWAEGIKRTRRQKGLPFTRYAYCSLFGVNSLNDLKTAIVERTIDLSKKEQTELYPTTESLQDVLKGAEALVRKGSWLVNIAATLFGYGAAGAVATRFMFWTIRNQIVCFDDLERKGPGLHLGDVLGLASHLKEECKCKVVMILNDEELDDDKGVFKKYLEKVVDLAAVFKPTPEECAEIAVKDGGAIGSQVAKCTAALGITNIRVIRRVEKLAQEIKPTVQSVEPRLMDQMVKTLAVLAWIELMPDAPTIEFVKDPYGTRGRPTDAPIDEAKARIWQEALHKLDLDNLGDMDATLVQGIRDGYFNTDLVAGLADILAKQMEKRDLEEALSNAWAVYRSSLKVQPSEVADALIKAVKVGPEHVTPSELDKVVGTMKSLGFVDEASELIQHVVANRPNQPRYFNLRPRGIDAEVKDAELIQAFEAKMATFVDDRSLKQVIHKMIYFPYETADMVRLKTADVNDLKEVLLSVEGGELDETVDKLLPVKEVGNNGKQIGLNVREALEQIASQSSIAEIRLRPYLDKYRAPASDAGA